MEIEEAANTYSFINVLRNDTRFSEFGSNALPLFALYHYLAIEDIAVFASDSLTDQPDDKKADFIYINEAEGIACIAQGYTAKDWGRKEAPANKASDLNTAAAWLLQASIGKIPETIRSHAKLLRDGLEQKTINKIVFVYAHNALESENVRRELKTVQDLVQGLALTKDAEIETLEIGLRQLEELHLTSQGQIQITDEVTLLCEQVIEESGSGWEAYIASLNGSVLFDLYEKHKSALFSANVRDFLGARKSSGNVNNSIKETAENNPANFFVLNNGITLITKKAEKLESGQLKIHGISIVNGAQTTGAIHASGRGNADTVRVLARIIVTPVPELVSNIVAGNNTQNSIVAWDRRSNDPIQIRLREEFNARGIEYVHRRDSSRKTATSIFSDKIGQMLCAFGGDLQTAIRAKADIFESDGVYNRVFPPAIGVGHVFAVQTLGWAYDKIKLELKLRSGEGTLTNIEREELKLMDYPASKQFLICVVGILREEIAGSSVSATSSFELNSDSIVPEATEIIEAWSSVLRSILPLLAQHLPAEQYQVVRSTEHTDAVARRAKSIIAASPTSIQMEFEELRKVLSISK